jgi:trehalose/maltose hydrolase-like predicted phosphorylase
MTGWVLRYEGVDLPGEGLREALCTLGNGYLATRGAAPEASADGTHYPGTYVAGCYNRLTDQVDDSILENESLVNLPNWLPLTFRIDNGPWFGQAGHEVLEHHQELHLQQGLLVRRVRVRDGEGRTTLLSQRRFVHMRIPYLAGLETTIVPENWSGTITVRSGIDGDVTNAGVARYRDLDGTHLTGHTADTPGPDIIRLVVQTRQSRIRVATSVRTVLFRDGLPVAPRRRQVTGERRITQDCTLRLGRHEHLTVEKLAAIVTSRDPAISEPAIESTDRLADAPPLAELLDSHLLAWRELWDRFRFEFEDDISILPNIRLHVFHLLQTVSPHTTEADVGVPARGLHGEAYRGHVLWDELFVFPLLTLRLPALTRALLRYRYRRLPQARRAARKAGHRGAMYPWQSGSDGREESQRRHLNPRSGRWLPDRTYLQRHIGIAVAYNVWQYYQATGDRDFLSEYGAEMILEIARFFADLADYDRRRKRYVIRGVVGPDEFHTGYPGRTRPGVDNNAYTNIMTAWLLTRAQDTLDALPPRRSQELRAALGLRADELHRWRAVSRALYVPFHSDGIISQFEGYERLTELDWSDYLRRYGNIQRLDRILEGEGKDPNSYQASKQADVLMLFYLLSADELGELLDQLGYPIARDTIPRTIDYYLARTAHGSTLSAVVHAWVLARANRQRAVEFLRLALDTDIHDIQGGTTAEGIHLAAMAGSVDLLQRCFTGIETRGDTLWLNPCWPDELTALEFDIHYRGRPLALRVSGTKVSVEASAGPGGPVLVGCRGRTVLLEPTHTTEFTLA